MSPNRKPDAAASEHAPLVDALASFVRSLVSNEMEALGRKLDDLDIELSRRIADLDERAESTLGAVKRELQTGLESVRTDVESAEGRHGKRLDEIAATLQSFSKDMDQDLRPRVETLDRLAGDLDKRLTKRIRDAAQSEQELRAAQQELGERFAHSDAAHDQRIRAALDQVEAAREKVEREVGVEREARQTLAERVRALSENVTSAEQRIQQQLDTSERLSSVLNTLTSVFTTQRVGGDSAAGPARADAKGSPDSAAPGTSSDSSLADLDSALNKLFPR